MTMLVNQIPPVVIDLGKKRRKAIKDFKRGRGKVMDEVQQAVEEARAGLGAAADGKEIVPVVIIYQKKVKRRRTLFG